MTADESILFEEDATKLVDWLHREVIAEARGDALDELDVDPSATFWMGTLAPEATVMARALGERGDRLDPCAVGMRVRPAVGGPWHLDVLGEATPWIRQGKGSNARWLKLAPARVQSHVVVVPGVPEQAFLADEFARAFEQVGARGLEAQLRVDLEGSADAPQLVITLVNTSPEDADLTGGHLFETRLTIFGLPTHPFLLEALPDSFRYDRRLPAYGINAGVVEFGGDNGLRTTDTVDVAVGRPEYWSSPRPAPDLRFATLATDPLPHLTELVDALQTWNDEFWGEANLGKLAAEHSWDGPLLNAARAGRDTANAEHHRLSEGLRLLTEDPQVLSAFKMMNESMTRSRHDSWRPFQIGFLLGTLRFLVDPEESDYVDTVWFATGGGKTETYLGLLVTTAFHDRLTGKMAGITAWSRFPLRLLSLQQTQRFAEAIAAAELTRRSHAVGGMPFTLGFYVGSGGTPNKIVKESRPGERHPDPESPGMPGDYQVLLRCPFCLSTGIRMEFDRSRWSLQHLCGAEDCPAPGDHLPIYIVDDEIYRFLPTVVVGTLDKAAGVGFQAAMRGFIGPPLGMCSVKGHGFTYASRRKSPSGCLVPDCSGTKQPVPQAHRSRFAPRLRLQDELHLLRDSLGAVDSHYESLLDSLQAGLGGDRAKIVASSATLSGHERQTHALYQRQGRVFPEQGPTADLSFWSRRGARPMRKFVAVAPRGSTLDHVTDRTTAVLQQRIRELVAQPGVVCERLGIDVAHVPKLVSAYGTDVIYGSTLYDVEAADRSLASNSSLGISSVQLTGQTDFDEVRQILERLENPEEAFEDRIHVVAASSMLSHGVDIARLNVMTMLGLPLSTAEFIQTSARVGRSYPGLVYVLHKIGRERDAQVFRQFGSYVRHGDRFVEPIPITRKSRRVLDLTMGGIVEALRLQKWEPQSGLALTVIPRLQEYARSSGIDPTSLTAEIGALLDFDDAIDSRLVDDIRGWLDTWQSNLSAPPPGVKWPNELGPTRAMISLRDVEESSPIRDRGLD